MLRDRAAPASCAPPGEFATNITFRGSGSEQDTASQQLEAGTTVRLPLEQLELVDLTFGLAAAPGRDERDLPLVFRASHTWKAARLGMG